MNKFIRDLRCNGDCELVYLRPFYNLDRDNIHYVCDYDEDKIGVNVFSLYEENQELKKQLEKKYSKIGTLTNEVLYEENTKLINQQKEFIEYLENEIKGCNNYSKYIENKVQELKSRSVGKTYIANEIMKNEVAKKILKEILSKFKEIIGSDKDEN